MVFDRIENIGTYLGTGEAMDAALNVLSDRIIVDGEQISIK